MILRSRLKLLPNVLVLCRVLLGAQDASSFPEMIRHGYASCKSCHYSPSGGGPINEYGETIASELLSTWGTENEGETFYGLFNLRPFALKGDFRYLWHRYRDDRVEINQRFPMQRELSLILNPSDNVSFVMSGGYYGLDTELSYRRYYGTVQLGGAWARAGRYLAPFGLEIADHTKGTKELFTQGGETLNAEVGYTARYGEVSFTRILGGDSTLNTSARPTVKQRDEKDGYTTKLSVFPWKGVRVDLGYCSLRDAETVRTFTQTGVYLGSGPVYAYHEYQSWPAGEFRQYAYAGWEVYRGIHGKVEIDRDQLEQEVFGTLQWFPRPHYEFSLSGSETQVMAVSHYYL